MARSGYCKLAPIETETVARQRAIDMVTNLGPVIDSLASVLSPSISVATS